VIGVIDYNFAAHTGVLRVMRSAWSLLLALSSYTFSRASSSRIGYASLYRQTQYYQLRMVY
jgi:hypothetical protein